MNEVSVRGAQCCSEEEIFDLCEGSLEPGRRREVRTHLGECAECQRRYERELYLSSALASSDTGERPYCSGDTSRSVAMALPTRSAYARLLWGVGAAALLAAVFASLAFYSARSVSFITHAMGVIWGLTLGVSDAAGILLAVAGPTLFIAFLAGALVDVLIAATLFAVARWRRLRGV